MTFLFQNDIDAKVVEYFSVDVPHCVLVKTWQRATQIYFLPRGKKGWCSHKVFHFTDILRSRHYNDGPLRAHIIYKSSIILLSGRWMWTVSHWNKCVGGHTWTFSHKKAEFTPVCYFTKKTHQALKFQCNIVGQNGIFIASFKICNWNWNFFLGWIRW